MVGTILKLIMIGYFKKSGKLLFFFTHLFFF